jgi:hypothetical protein
MVVAAVVVPVEVVGWQQDEEVVVLVEGQAVVLAPHLELLSHQCFVWIARYCESFWQL